MRAGFSWLAIATMLGGCATTQQIAPLESAENSAHSRPAIACSDGSSTIDSDFAGSAMAGCQVVSDGHYRLLIRQEDRNVTNCSAWYAFRVQSAVESKILVDLDYESCGHRYRPKLWLASADDEACTRSGNEERRGLFARLGKLISRQRGDCSTQQNDTPLPGATWTPLDAQTYSVENTGDGEIPQARLALTAGPAPRIVSSQELLLPDDYRVWFGKIEQSGKIRRSELGRSLEGHEIELLEIPATEQFARGQLVVVGRQHPPEVTGALALFAFVERLLEDDDLARRYRARFTTNLVPLLNPDGVLRGHWRHSRGERDLNRDWGPFTQPETRLVRDMMEAMEADPTRDIRFFMDFHSTGRDVLYTLDKELTTNPPGFMDAWVADYQARLQGYDVAEQPGHNPQSTVSKAWTFERFGIPSVTYEIGDETDRDLIRKLGRAAAETTMTQLLANDSPAD